MLLALIKRMSANNNGQEITDIRNYKVSDLLPTNFVESNLELDNQIARDDAWLFIQQKLNESSNSIQVNLLFDKKVAISDTLRIGSNTTINFIDGCGAVMMNGKGLSIFKNRTHRPYVNANIIDYNIKIIGKGILNGNAKNVPRGTNGQGISAGMAWHGVKDLLIDGIRIFNHKTYAQIATNVVNGTLKNFVTDVGTIYQSDNMDGVHWDGWCSNCVFENGVVKSNDDAYCCNADDGYGKWASFPINKGCLEDFYDINFSGPSNNITIKNCVINNENTIHGFGVRILSAASRVDNVNIINLKGFAKDYAVLIDTYAWYANSMDYSGKGNVGRVFVDDFNVQVGYSNMNNIIPKGQFSVTCSIEDFQATNVVENSASNIPMLHKSIKDKNNNTLDYGVFKINGIDY